jgi:hypothetical protein
MPEAVLDALRKRMEQVGVRADRIVYCKDGKRRGFHEHTEFTFFGFTFRARGGCGPGPERGGGLAHGGLLAMERECQAGNDEGQEKDRQDALSAASEGDDLTLGGVERFGSAGVSAVADLQGVPPGFDRYVDGLVQLHGPGTLAVDHGVVRAAADFHSNGFVRQLQRCGHLLISSGFWVAFL